MGRATSAQALSLFVVMEGGAMSENDVCTWKKVDEMIWTVWDTSCGESPCIDGSDPADIGYRFCPYCGRRLVWVSLAHNCPGEEA